MRTRGAETCQTVTTSGTRAATDPARTGRSLPRSA
ncbi:hypothetical protein OPKNFCMD_2432 [Methylobacterium crusticola]|uniref:Uncharacterized protein n=1 Tax=Methylobacterium crusticola TaxID=1697972 RepID=A0ABQ4QYG0_9HYPH|nr:hypothetical protein OPKNFCMD_2432 [Methylobacterium crusticola]